VIINVNFFDYALVFRYFSLDH